MGGMSSVGVFLRDPSSYLYEFWRKTTENSEWLGQQAQPGIEHGTSHLPVLECRTTDGANDKQFDIHALPGIQTQDLWCSSRLP